MVFRMDGKRSNGFCANSSKPFNAKISLHIVCHSKFGLRSWKIFQQIFSSQRIMYLCFLPLWQQKNENPLADVPIQFNNVFCMYVRVARWLLFNPNLGKFWRALDWKMLMYFMAIWNILQRFGIFYDHQVHFVFIWYIFPRFLVSCTKKNLATLLRNVT
jgi:hypothetical protein